MKLERYLKGVSYYISYKSCDKMEEGFTEENKLSKLNSGYWINLRLHNLWEEAHINKKKDDFYSWNKNLDAIWCELGGDESEGSENCKLFDNIDDKLYSVIKFAEILHKIKGNFGHNKADVNVLKMKREVNKILMNKELFLRRLQNKQGKGTAYMDEEDDWE